MEYQAKENLMTKTIKYSVIVLVHTWYLITEKKEQIL